MSSLAPVYATLLQGLPALHWDDVYREATRTQSEAHLLILVHPVWYAENRDAAYCPVRGPRRFSVKAPIGSRCQSERVWHYSCGVGAPHLEADHSFPWRLGGPTTSSNITWLCREHNLAKGPDWHVGLRPLAELEWFADVFERVSRIVSE